MGGGGASPERRRAGAPEGLEVRSWAGEHEGGPAEPVVAVCAVRARPEAACGGKARQRREA